MDFVHDRLADGRVIRYFAAIDVYTRECIALQGQQRWSSADVAGALRRVVDERGAPHAIMCDNGSAFCALPMDQWAYWNHVKLDYSRPGTPTDNATIHTHR